MKIKAQSIIGDGNNRNENDFYETPEWATEALLENETFQTKIWEPACGKGAISKVLLKTGYKVYSTDLIYRDYGFCDKIDFLVSDIRTEGEEHYDIITNPPFNKALQFINHAKEISSDKIAMLLKTQFLEGVSRQSMFLDKEFPLKCMYQFSKRLTFGGKKSGGMLAFAWFVWEKSYVGEPMVRWI